MLDHTTNEHIGWSEERTALLKRRWKEGASATEIARELGGGVTRNDVIGKVSRLKLPPHGANPPKARTPRVKRTPEQKAEDSRLRGKMLSRNAGQPKAAAIVHRIIMQREDPPTPLPAEDGVDVTHLIGIMQLTDRTCRFPIGDPLTEAFGFCGDPTQPGSKYCPHHHRRAYHQI